MTSLECARAAFAVLCENSPANHCRLEGQRSWTRRERGPRRMEFRRTLTEGLYGGKAIVNVSQQGLRAGRVPTVGDPVRRPGASFSLKSFTSREGAGGAATGRTEPGPWPFYWGNAGGARGNVVLAVPASLCARGGGGPRRYFRRYPPISWRQGVPQEGEIIMGLGCCPVVLPPL